LNKSISIYGFTIEPALECAAVEWIVTRAKAGAIRSTQVETHLESLGVPRSVRQPDGYIAYVSNRAADRLLQNAKKAGLIACKGPWWRATEPKETPK